MVATQNDATAHITEYIGKCALTQLNWGNKAQLKLLESSCEGCAEVN